MTKLKLHNLNSTMWKVMLLVFLAVIVGYIIYKMVNTVSEGFTLDITKRYILKNTSENINDTISYIGSSIKYTNNTNDKIATPFRFEPAGSNQFRIVIPESYLSVELSGRQNLGVNALFYSGNKIIYYDNSGTVFTIDNIDAILYVEPTTTKTGETTTTTGFTTTTTGFTTTTGETTTTIPTITKPALNEMLDSIQPVIDSSNDMLEFPRYKFIDNQQRLDTLAQRIDTLMNNLQLNKSISIPEKPIEVTFF